MVSLYLCSSGSNVRGEARAPKGRRVSSKGPSRVWDGDEGAAGRNGRKLCLRFALQTYNKKKKQKKIELMTRPDLYPLLSDKRRFGYIISDTCQKNHIYPWMPYNRQPLLIIQVGTNLERTLHGFASSFKTVIITKLRNIRFEEQTLFDTFFSPYFKRNYK